MDPEYLEFSLDVTVDDGSCLTPIVLGCMDESAANTNLMPIQMTVLVFILY